LLLLAESPEAKSIRVVRGYQPGLPCIEADAKQLGQVFLNLILNAVQAMPGGGCVTIATQVVNWSSRESVDQANRDRRGPSPPIHQFTNPRVDQSGWVEVAVSDTGPGIPPNILPDIFTPFVSTKRRGTGLGLSVSRRIVEDHGGLITAGTEPGQGATFRVFLPLDGSNPGAEERRP
jgi:signal transduction histidine kinase